MLYWFSLVYFVNVLCLFKLYLFYFEIGKIYNNCHSTAFCFLVHYHTYILIIGKISIKHVYYVELNNKVVLIVGSEV